MKRHNFLKYTIIIAVTFFGIAYLFNFISGINRLQGNQALAEFNKKMTHTETASDKLPDYSANMFLINGKYTDGLTYIDSIIDNSNTLDEIHPNTVESLIMYKTVFLIKQGEKRLLNKDYKNAIIDFEKVANAKPQYYNKLSKIYKLDQQVEKSKEAYKKYLAYCEHNKEVEKAMKWFRKSFR